MLTRQLTIFMETIRKHCFVLRALVNDADANRDAIRSVVAKIEQTMRMAMAARTIPELRYTQYPAMCHVDVLFEALCFCFFVDLFAVNDTRVIPMFIKAFAPFYDAGIMRYITSAGDQNMVVPNCYIHRFVGIRRSVLFKAAPSTMRCKALAKPVVRNRLPFYKAACFLRPYRTLDVVDAANILCAMAQAPVLHI